MSSSSLVLEGWPIGVRRSVVTASPEVTHVQIQGKAFQLFLFFTSFPNFQGKYLLSGNYRKHETFCLNCGYSKVPLDVELYHGPLRPFEKIEFENLIFIK